MGFGMQFLFEVYELKVALDAIVFKGG